MRTFVETVNIALEKRVLFVLLDARRKRRKIRRAEVGKPYHIAQQHKPRYYQSVKPHQTSHQRENKSQQRKQKRVVGHGIKSDSRKRAYHNRGRAQKPRLYRRVAEYDCPDNRQGKPCETGHTRIRLAENIEKQKHDYHFLQRSERQYLIIEVLQRNVNRGYQDGHYYAEKTQPPCKRGGARRVVIVFGRLHILDKKIRKRQNYGRTVHDYGYAAFQHFCNHDVGLFTAAHHFEQPRFVVVQKLGDITAVNDSVHVYLRNFFVNFVYNLHVGNAVDIANRHACRGIFSHFNRFHLEIGRFQTLFQKRQI